MRPQSEHITVNVPAIIDRETWERAQAQRRINAADSRRNRQHDYLLTGFIECSCGRNMSGQFCGKRRYHCISSGYRNRLDDVCREKAIDAERAETIVWNSITAKFENPTAFRDELELARAKGTS